MTRTSQAKSADDSNTMRKKLLAAGADKRLLQHLSTTRYEAIDTIAATLAEAHNSDDLDVLARFESDTLEDAASQAVHKVAELFRRMFPLIQCTVAEGLESVSRVNRRLRDAGVDGTAHYALAEWLRAGEGRAEEALSLVLRDTDVDAGVLRAVLTAGDDANAEKFTTQALELSTQPRVPIREAALSALGRIVPLGDAALVARTLERLGQAIETSVSDREAGSGPRGVAGSLSESTGPACSRCRDDHGGSLQEAVRVSPSRAGPGPTQASSSVHDQHDRLGVLRASEHEERRA